jgi:hypothetical protein
MLYVLAHKIRRVAAELILATDLKLDNLPLFFTQMADFLEREPAANFELTTAKEISGMRSDVPLGMNKEVENHFDAALKDFPDVVRSGKAGMDFSNLLYYLGQALLRIPMIIQAISLLSDRHHLKVENLEAQAKPLFEIWGGEATMNARRLFERYSGETNEIAIKDLVNRLRKSAEISEKNLKSVL